MMLEIADIRCRRPDIPSGNGLIFFGLANPAVALVHPDTSRYVSLCFISPLFRHFTLFSH